MRYYPKQIIERTRKLRQAGWSLGEINRKLKIPSNTISGWVKDIKLSDKQKKRIKQKIANSGKIGRTLAVAANRRKF